MPVPAILKKKIFLPIVIGIGMSLAVSLIPCEPIFVSGKWKKSLLVYSDTVRLEMVDDLLRRYKLVGMSRMELEKLLGKPPPTKYFHNYDYVYWLGPERGFISIDSEWLCVKFKGDTVVEARICRD